MVPRAPSHRLHYSTSKRRKENADCKRIKKTVLGGLRLWLGPDVARPRTVLESVCPLPPSKGRWGKVFLLGEHVPSGLGSKKANRHLHSGPDISIVIIDTMSCFEPSWGLI